MYLKEIKQMELNWRYKSFEDLTAQEVYAILQLRSEVFVVEQNCVYQDIDGKDQKSFHLMGWEGGDLVAYCRLVKPGVSFVEASIGRVITSPKYRGNGFGIALIEKALAQIVETFGVGDIKIGAQLYLKKFYGSFGFVQTSEMYLEDDIPHIEMLLAAKT
jgi:ElaA protein